MSLALVSSFDKTKTAAGSWARLDFTPTGGSLVKISCKVADIGGKLSTLMLKQPGPDAIARAVDEVPLEADEDITLTDIEEIDAVLAVLGASLTGFKKGTAKLYIRDPRDDITKVRFMLTKAAGAAFECSLKRVDGSTKFGGGDFAKNSLVCTNLSGAALVWGATADAPDTVA
jgi:hypothetical protein